MNLTVSMRDESTPFRKFHQLEVERSKVVFFTTMWTIVHPVNEESPLYGLTEEEVLEKDAEFIIMIKAFDESFSQTVYSRSSYKASEIKWGEKFVYLSQQRGNGISVDVGRINETEKKELNPYPHS